MAFIQQFLAAFRKRQHALLGRFSPITQLCIGLAIYALGMLMVLKPEIIAGLFQ